MNGGIVDMVFRKLKPVFDEKMDSIRDAVLEEVKQTNDKLDKIMEMLKENRG